MSVSNSEIGTLTAEALQQHCQKWKKIATTHNPINRKIIKQAVRQVYEVVRLPPPRYVIFLESPFLGAIATAMLTHKDNQSPLNFAEIQYETVVRSFIETLSKNVWRMADNRSSSAWWRQIESALYQQLGQQYGNVRAQLVDGFWMSTAMLNDPVGLQPSFYESTGGVLTHITAVLETTLPKEYLTGMGQIRSRGLAHTLIPSARAAAYRCGLGCHDTEIPFYEFFRQSGFNLPELDGMLTICQNCGWWWPMKNVCIITERPRYIRTDEQGRLHSGTGRAFEYLDSWSGYSWHGTYLPKRFIQFTQSPNAHDIFNEPNVELRRMMLDIFGLEQFMLASGARPVQADECGTIYQVDFAEDEPLVMVAVTNSTPEPDGHYKRYFLRVPPTIRTAREAVAWTFGMRPEQYDPLKQT